MLEIRGIAGRKHWRVAAVVACQLSLAQQVSSAPADPFLAAIASMKKSIGAVVCQKPAVNGRFSPLIDGTAFFTTRSGEFLTAAHVVRDFLPGGSLQNCHMGVWFAQGANAFGHVEFEMFPVSGCVADNLTDVGRCVTASDLTKLAGIRLKPVPVTIEPSPRADGTGIAVTGYPLSSLLPITSRGFVAAYVTDAQGDAEIALDRAAWPGGSGSPVYDSQGKVLGLVSQAGEGFASGISYARASSSILRSLATHPLPSARPAAPPAPVLSPAPPQSGGPVSSPPPSSTSPPAH